MLAQLLGQINDANNPYKTLQAAIDAVHAQLGVQHSPGATTQGIVHALPGLYGVHGTGSSGDVFPIRMRDRVHLQGAGARNCVIRGTRTMGAGANTTAHIFWPDGIGQPSTGTGGGAGMYHAEVLLDYGVSALRDGGFWTGNTGVPWSGTSDTAEMLDRLSFEGGDVQVLISSRTNTLRPEELRGRITNCIFDMRHDWPITVNPPAGNHVSGPFFGIMMTKNLWTEPPTFGYREQRFLIANNTFALAHYSGDADYEKLSRDEAVGIIDVTSPCNGAMCENPRLQRGLGSPIVANNLFRLPPIQNDRRRAMLGIEDTDVRVDDGTANFVACNAFPVTTLAMSTSNYNGTSGFYSQPMRPATVFNGQAFLLVNCTGTSCTPVLAPSPGVVLWDGSTSTAPQQFDPGFVGEYLESFISASGPTLPRILDWRLLPDSALKNKGVITNVSGSTAPPPTMLIAQNGTGISDSACKELSSFRWDGEGHGNPRIIEGTVDIGFDEIDSMIACGSWGNHSNSHNAPSPLLQATAQQGRVRRLFIFDLQFSNRACKIVGAGAIPANPPPAWSRPPETLTSPSVNASLPLDRRTKYIPFTNDGPTPTGPLGPGWVIASSSMMPQAWIPPSALHPPGAPNRLLTLLDAGVDDELTAPIPPGSAANPPEPNLYFGCQAVLLWTDGITSATWWSNLQSEYR